MGDRRPWMKWYPADWRADPRLRMCSYAARGLWTDLLSLMHEAEPYGHLLINGIAPSNKQIASLLGGSEREIKTLVAELEHAGVFSRTNDGTIYSRRMVRDKAQSDTDTANGKRGGNPKITQPLNGGVNPSPEPKVKTPDKAHMLEARSQKLESKNSDPDGSVVKTRASPRSDAFEPMVEIWRAELGDRLAVPLKPVAARMQKAAARLRDSFSADLDRWRAYCGRIRSSPFLCGDNDRGWKADFDWALEPRNVAHVEEGKFDGRRINGNGLEGISHDRPTGPPPTVEEVEALRRARHH